MMSGKERDRLKVLHEVKEGHLTQRGAAGQLGIRDRWVRKLLVRVKKEGDGGVVHRLRGKESNRRLPESLRGPGAEAGEGEVPGLWPHAGLRVLGQERRGGGEQGDAAAVDDGGGVAAGEAAPGGGGARVAAARRSCRGELVQWDTSVHDWLEGRGPRLYLVAMIDDASSQAYGRFVEQDSTEENLRVLWGYLERWGRPVEFYTDKSSLFTVNRPAVEAADEAVKEEWTQIGRALRELGIGWIAAHSPQAKGRIERFFGTAQDRLVKGLRLARADSLEAAQTYLEQEYLPQWNQSFTRVAGGQHRCASTAGRGA